MRTEKHIADCLPLNIKPSEKYPNFLDVFYLWLMYEETYEASYLNFILWLYADSDISNESYVATSRLLRDNLYNPIKCHTCQSKWIIENFPQLRSLILSYCDKHMLSYMETSIAIPVSVNELVLEKLIDIEEKQIRSRLQQWKKNR